MDIPFQKAKRLLREGDVLLFKGDGVFSFFIKRVSEGKYSHVAVVSGHGSNGDTIWECVEFREWKGGRTVNLEQYVNNAEGSTIDVYRASDIKTIHYVGHDQTIGQADIELDTKIVTNLMRRMTGLPYGWKRILYIALLKIPFLRFMYSIDQVVDDDTKEMVYPVCSTAVAHAFSRANFDLVHHRSDKATQPSDIARSPLLSYLFTLVPDSD